MRESLQQLDSLPAAEPGLVDWREVACPLCQGRSWDVLVEGRDRTAAPGGLWFAVVKCRDCGLCFTNPRPSVESIGRFYSSAQRPRKPRHGLSAALRAWSRTRDERRALAWQGRGRLLDLGCGSGDFLQRMRQQGWQATGIDLADDAVRRRRDEVDLRVLPGSLPHAKLEAGSFDVVTMWQSLAHVYEPLEVLREARRLLKRGGRLIVAVPSIDSLSFRWFGPDWDALDLPRRLTHFTPVTLHSMLKLAGFHVHEIRPDMRSPWLRASARPVGTSKRPLWKRALRLKPVAHLVMLYAALTRQADGLIATAIA